MNPLFLEIFAICVSGVGAALVVYGAWSTTRSWANHPLALIEPLLNALSKVARYSGAKQKKEHHVGSAVAELTLTGSANAYGRLHPIGEVEGIDDLTQKVNVHLDHIYQQHGATSKRIFKQGNELKSSLRELDREVEKRFDEASQELATVEATTGQEFVSAARFQVAGSAIVVLSLFLQMIAKVL